MNPSRLQIELKIAQIEASGEVAEANTWISSFIVYKKSGKTYKYYRLMRAERDREGKLKRRVAKYLGKKGSTEHKQMMEAIARRNKIQELQRKLKRLTTQGQPQPKRRSRTASGVNSPLTTSDRVLLLQLQQQLTQLMARFEQLERQLQGGQNLSGESQPPCFPSHVRMPLS